MKKTPSPQPAKIESFDLPPGRILARKYEILGFVGSGWQGEVYMIRERATGIERAVKLFFPHRNANDKTAVFYARKLHKLRSCPILIQYHNQEKIRCKGQDITCLISDFVEGELLSEFLLHQPEERLPVFEGLHLLNTLAAGVQQIHTQGEYHGDLHADNVIIRRYGLGFEIKLVDLFHWGGRKRENIQEDVFDLIRLFYDAIGGKTYYAGHPPIVKQICCGLKKSLIAKKFKTAGHLRKFLETMEWD
ncbi:MAG: protein kinase [Candidatus Omnitrophica bacterium]|nr:protein kinase [Candidatus Omnitrophota bacterium]